MTLKKQEDNICFKKKTASSPLRSGGLNKGSTLRPVRGRSRQRPRKGMQMSHLLETKILVWEKGGSGVAQRRGQLEGASRLIAQVA